MLSLRVTRDAASHKIRGAYSHRCEYCNLVRITLGTTWSLQNKKRLHFKSITVLTLYLRPLLHRVATKTSYFRVIL